MDNLTDTEKYCVALVRLNKVLKKVRIIKKWKLGTFEMTFKWRSKKNLWGRFGAGWNWSLGFEVGGRTIIFNLLVFSLRFDYVKGVKNDSVGN